MRSVLLLALALAGCGSTKPLEPPAGRPPIPVAQGATAPATTGELLTPGVQARPGRGDSTLRRSEERRSDDFDLPPN
ncbi:hypothetical protein [Sphingomonas corticis]|uniref:Argininosuccinate lyase n=1 Tax=Sphingomonas corticis TaxID=2722791 RepID=A0ABX1CIH9_9SPHN|nr:hypothetical protein [Sphingomonas corticis]NJR77802.1 hypothetical protein [Sphingomonas corticis]